jgi:hypothetical protein
MSKIIASLVAALFFLMSTSAYAQATRTWVSGVGDDANPCSRTAPCKTFAGAISKTATNGEISCLDPGGFGGVTITKSITIDCVGTNGSILAANANGVLINGAGAVVTLRNITINGANTTTGNGVRILQAGAVNIDNVTIENIGGVAPSNGRGVTIETSSANMRVTIQNSRFYNINSVAIHSIPPAGNVILSIDNVSIARGGATAIQFLQNTVGVLDNVRVTNHSIGAAITLEATSTSANISNSFFAQNAIGVFNGNGGGAPTMRLYHNVITGNTSSGLTINAGSVISLGNNLIQGNAGNQTPSSTIGTQ